jgi:hypothetical protein
MNGILAQGLAGMMKKHGSEAHHRSQTVHVKKHHEHANKITNLLGKGLLGMVTKHDDTKHHTKHHR